MQRFNFRLEVRCTRIGFFILMPTGSLMSYVAGLASFTEGYLLLCVIKKPFKTPNLYYDSIYGDCSDVGPCNCHALCERRDSCVEANHTLTSIPR